MNKIKIILILITLSIYGPAFAQETLASEKLNFYLDQARIAVENSDFPHACRILRHTEIYLDQLKNEKLTTKIRGNREKICSIASKKDAEQASQLRESLVLFGILESCPQFKQAKSFCANTPNYHQCMTIRYGQNYKIAEDSRLCLFSKN
jgi:hypothetical protein